MNNHAFSPNFAGTEESLILDALVALRTKAGIDGKLIDSQPESSRRNSGDARVILSYEGNSIHYLAECKFSLDRKAQIVKIRQQLVNGRTPGLLITAHITRELAHHCRATGLQFIDTSGNAYLQAAGLFVFITGEKSEHKPSISRIPKGLTNPAALRVVFTLLANRDDLDSPYKDIARHAGVSLGTAYNVLEDLEHRGYLISKKGAGSRRRLLEAGRLIDEWAINYPTTLRNKLHGRRFSAPESSWWKDVDLAEFDHAWSAEVAAAKMIGYLKPGTQTLYVGPGDMDKVIKMLVKQHRIRPDEAGELEILEKFWHWDTASVPELAPPLLIYSELLAILDPRTQETARMIKEKFIDTAFDQAGPSG